ncbi:MAG: B12-binding domain-containing protein [Syntrophobacterales bacterium]|nr:MAG: B12-binding domain-containing protein [Syntrophobacterales bacterium]
MSTMVKRISREIVSGHIEESIRAVREALQHEIPPQEILDDGLIPAMERVGFLFQEGEIFIPDVFFFGKSHARLNGYPSPAARSIEINGDGKRGHRDGIG